MARDETAGRAPVHLAVHSAYSFHGGTALPERLARAAKERGFGTLALTDLNGLYGAVGFYQACREHGLKPLIGATLDDPQRHRRRAVALARDSRGYEALCRLCSARQLEPAFNLSSSLREHADGLIILTSSPQLARELAPELPPGSLYLKVLPPEGAASTARLKRLLALAQELHLPPAAANDVWMLDAADWETHRLLRAIGQNEIIHRVQDAAPPQRHLLAAAGMERAFAAVPEALANTRRIADDCNLELPLGKIFFPRFPLPPGETPEQRLRTLAEEGVRRRYPKVTPKVRARLNYELGVINQLGFASYLLVVHDIVAEANRRGIPNLGRGSAANSMVCYALNLTHVEPLAHNLYFERFMNPERESPPDVDIDFNWKRRDEIVRYVYERYGAGRVAMISTHVTFQARSALRESAKAMGLLDRELERFIKRLPFWGADGLLDKVGAEHPEVRGLDLSAPEYRAMFAQAAKLSGLPRHLGIHVGGIVIAPEHICRHTALYEAAKGFVVTQYEMFGVEDIGLVKIDLLGNRSLGVLEDALASLRRRGITPPVDDFTATTTDPRTVEMVKSGRTMGCFYIESPGMRQLLQKLGTRTFEELTAASSVIRPGVAESGMMQEYIRRHRNPEFIRHLHPKLAQVLTETHGVMIYQEDVMKVAHELAGMSLAQADLLRRAMSGKLRSPEAMAEMRDSFLQQCHSRGVKPAVAQELWRQIRSFAGYAFCKAHSAAFAVLSFQVAYLKAHHPAEFMAGVLSNHGGFYATGVYIQECRRLGLRVLPPCVNRSDLDFTAEDEGRAVRVGLREIAGVHTATLESILAARERDGVFTSLRDLLRRTRCRYTDLQVLALVGALDCFGFTRPQLLWLLQCEFASSRGNGGFLELDDGDGAELLAQLPPLTDYAPLTRCRLEVQYLGYGVEAHPLTFFLPHMGELVAAEDLLRHAGKRVRLAGWCIATKRVETRKRVPVQERREASSASYAPVARLRPSDELGITGHEVLSAPTVRVPTGRAMKFMSMEDLTGTYEAVLFPEAYERFAPIATRPGPFIVTGRVDAEYGSPTVDVSTLELASGLRFSPKAPLLELAAAESGLTTPAARELDGFA